jgi:hypothetical protein
MTLKEVKERIKGLDEEQAASVVCALVGQVTCARCGEIMGEVLLGSYDGKDTVVVGHDCPACHSNYEKMGWRDKFMAPYPFKVKEEVADYTTVLDDSFCEVYPLVKWRYRKR